jgi:hypothetical protein
MVSFFGILLLMTATGFGFVTYFLPKNKENDLSFALLVSPLVGSAIISITGVFYIEYALSIAYFKDLNLLLLTCSTLLTVHFICLEKKAVKIWLEAVLKSLNNNTGIILISILAILILVCSFALKRGDFLVYHYISDTSAYFGSAEHLISGRTIKDPTDHAIFAWVFSFFRYGLLSNTVYLTKIFGGLNIEIAFCVVVINYGFGVLAALRIFHKILPFKNGIFYSFVPVISILNPGVVYYLQEGFYPHIMTIGIFSLVISIFYLIRSEKLSISDSIKNNKLYYFLLIMFVINILTTYHEFYVMLILFALGLLVMDVVLRNVCLIKIDLLFITIILVISPAIVLPFSASAVEFMIGHFGELKSSGYILPAWSMPSDIIGLTNIFVEVKKYYGGGMPVQEVGGGLSYILYYIIVRPLASIFAIIVLLNLIIREKKIDRVFFAVQAIGIVGLFVLGMALKHNFPTNFNYMYSKMITVFMPSLSILFCAALSQFLSEEKFWNKSKIILSSNVKIALNFIVIALFLFSFATYFTGKYKYNTNLDLKFVEFLKNNDNLKKNFVFVTNPLGMRNDKVISQLRFVDGSTEVMMSVLSGIYMPAQYVSPLDIYGVNSLPKDKKIIIIVRKDYINDKMVSYINALPKDQIVFSFNNYIGIKTDWTLNNFNYFLLLNFFEKASS